jgi:flagellar biosynthesis anti-sigma factor FlgM
MRIDLNAKIDAMAGSEATNASKPATSGPSTSGVAGDDNTSLSFDSTRVASLTAAVRQLPEVREEKVTALAALVRQGSYQVPTQQLAEALMNNMLPA